MKRVVRIALVLCLVGTAAADPPPVSEQPVKHDPSNNWLPALSNGNPPNLPVGSKVNGIVIATGGDVASEQVNGSGTATITWTGGKTFLRQTNPLTASVVGFLPAASSFPAGRVITYGDSVTPKTAAYGVAWTPQGLDTINGGTDPVTVGTGPTTARFETDGVSAWTQLDSHLSITSIQDAINPAIQVALDVSAMPVGTSTIHIGAGTISDLLGTTDVRGIAKDIYIAVRTDGRTGTGTAEDPFNAGGSDDNAKATAFDGLMNNYQSTSNVIFHLSAGDYRTDIENRTWVPQPGWRMEGAGMYGTTVKGVTSASSLGAFDHEVIKATLSVATDSFVLRNLTLDANGSVISALAPLANSERNCSVYGLSIAGSNILIENVRVIHQYGSAANLQEAFGLSVRGPSTSNGKNNEIRNCGAELPTGNYGAPFSMAGFTGHPLADSRVIGSWGYGLSGTGATIGFSSGGVNAAYFTNLTVRGNTFIDCASIFYQDTGTTDGLIVDGNILIGGYRGIALEATTLTGGTTKQNISITKNTIGIKNRVNGSIEGIFIGNADTTNVNISGDNLVTYDSSGAGTSTPWGVQASNVVSGICRQNCFADVNNKFLGTGVLRSKNRGPDGAILADANIADNDIPTYIGSLTSGYGIRIASDKIEFLYNGAQAVRFDSSGDVVAKTGGAYEWDQQGALFTAADGQFYFTNWAGSPSTVRLGLGTNSPTSALQVGPTSNTATKYQQLFGGYNGTTGYPNILINNSGSEFLGIGALGPDLAIGSSASPAGNGWDVQFSRVFQTDGGMLLGTGTSSPGAKVFQAEGGYKSGDGTTGATGTDGFNSFKNGLATTIGTISGGDKLGLTPTAVKTANYSAAAGDLVPVDTTSGNVTVTLPTAPADKTVVAIKHVIQGSTNTVSLATGGSDVFNKAGGGTTGTLTLVNQGLLLQYKASGAIWYAIADDVPLSGMDTRYVQAAGTLAIASFGSVTGTLAVANGGTGITSFGSGIATFLGTPTEANLKSVVSGLGWLDTAGTWTAAQINSTAGAASAPAMKYSGVPFAGTGTTSFPLVYLNDSSATASTTLATAGTYLGVNGHGTADLANFLLDGTSKVKISSAGAITAAGNVLTSASYIGFSSSTVFRNQSDGVVTLFDNANTSFGRLQLGGTTSSFPAIKRSSAGIAFRLADDSADTDITAANAIVSGTTDSTTSTTGSLKTAGGLGVAKNLNVGGSISAVGTPFVYSVASDVTTTSTTFVNVTGIAFAVAANKNYAIVVHLAVNKNDTNGMQMQLTGPASPTLINFRTVETTINNVSFTNDVVTAFSSAGSTFNTYNGTGFWEVPAGLISNGANAGTVQVQFKSITGGTSTVYAGSWIQVTQVN